MSPEEQGTQPETLRDVLKSLPLRVLVLVWKVLSMQGVVLVLGTWLVYEKRIESYAWLITCSLVLFGRYALDFVREIKR